MQSKTIILGVGLKQHAVQDAPVEAGGHYCGLSRDRVCETAASIPKPAMIIDPTTIHCCGTFNQIAP